MKIRTFLTTLTLFLIVFNLGILLISVTSYRDMVRQEKDRSLNEHYFITSALVKDLHAVESRGIDVQGAAGSLLQPYSYLSGNKHVTLALYGGDTLIYSNRLAMPPERGVAELPADGSRLVSLHKADGHTFVTVSGKLPAPYDSYALVYQHDMSDAVAAWKRTKNILFWSGAALSCLLALGLLILLNRIFRPLAQIAQTSRKIAAGAYGTRLPVTGKDELSEMAQSFNHMAEEIQRQMTELIAAAERKQQFVDNFAHELRTPLTAIYGYAELLQKASLTEEDRLSALGYIMSESRRMQTMAYQLLDLANLASNEPEWEKLSLSTLFESVRQTLQRTMEEKEISMEIRCEVKDIRGDANLLQSLFVNLIDNAMKACRKGGRIRVHAFDEAGKTIVTIRDNGIGMTPDVLKHITEPFYRAEKSRNRKGGGAGLGLAICKQIVSLHGAGMKFASSPGEGTTVTLTFTTSS